MVAYKDKWFVMILERTQLLVAENRKRSYRTALINQRPYAMCRYERRHRQQSSKHVTLVSDRFPEMGSRGFG